jgi:hypothetical protein
MEIKKMELEKAVEIVKLIAKCGEFEPLDVKGEWKEFVKFSAEVKKDAIEKTKKVKLWAKLHGNILPKETLDTTIDNLSQIQEAAAEVIRDKEVIPEKYRWEKGLPIHKDGEFDLETSSLIELLTELPWFSDEGFQEATPEVEVSSPRSFNTGSGFGENHSEEEFPFTTIEDSNRIVETRKFEVKK